MNLVRPFFPKSGHFSLNFEKGQGRPRPLPRLVMRLIFLMHIDFLTMTIISYFIVAKRCLSLWIYKWLGKIQWNIITWKIRFLQKLKYGSIADADYAQTKRVCKYFEMTKLGDYHDLYVWSDKLLLADVFENFRNFCFEIY